MEITSNSYLSLSDDSQVSLFNNIQKKLGKDCKLFVVGDLKQSIYRFRGATLSAFDLLISNNQNLWESFSLSLNYRTDLELLEKYDYFFGRMGKVGYLPYHAEDKLIGQREISEEDCMVCVEIDSSNEKDYYDSLYNLIIEEENKLTSLNKLKRLSLNEKTIALLTRSNYQVDKIVDEMSQRGINIDVSSGGDLYQIPSTIDFYKLLLCICDNYNVLNLVNLLESNYFNVFIDYQCLKNMNISEKRNLLHNILDDYCVKKMGVTWLEIVSMCKKESILVIIKLLFDGLKPWINYSENVYKQKKYISDYRVLQEKIINFSYKGNISALEMLSRLHINIVTSQKSMATKSLVDDSKSVKIVCNTVHKSKGLEYGVVILPFNTDEINDLTKQKIDANYSNEKLSYVVKFENGIIEKNDNYNYENEVDEQIQEESRILYVAMTRAIQKLIWIKDVSKNPKLSWSVLLEEDYEL